MKEFIFVILLMLAVGSAFFIAFSRNMVHSVFSLLVTLSAVAGFYVLLGADFLAGIQLLVYVGGILVLLIFAVMLTQGIVKSENNNPVRRAWLPFVIALVFIAIWVYGIWNVNWTSGQLVNEPITKSIGNNLLTKYLLPFEVISILLLVGLIGAVAVVRLALQKPSDEK